MIPKQRIVEELIKAKPKARPAILEGMHRKNLQFFRGRNPALADALAMLGCGPYRIRITEKFLDVEDASTRSLICPAGKLLEYTERLGSWHHSGWIDKLEILHTLPGKGGHHDLLLRVIQRIYASLPALSERMRSGDIRLPKLREGGRFSGATVFLGTLTGLHIVHYLNTTVVRDIVIIEPDLGKFALSTWFVDYAAIEKRFNRLVLHVGDDLPESPLDHLVEGSRVSASAWLRILKGYPSDAFEHIISRTHIRWREFHDIFVPYDRELRNLQYGAANLRAGLPILCRPGGLSATGRVAVVASGPSLDGDMAWLRENRDKLIILAVHSAVRALRGGGITPDFQCSLDTELSEEALEKLQLDPDVPFISYYKCSPDTLQRFRTVLLVPELGKANPVLFLQPVRFTHPTSGNFAAGVGLFLRPRELYLLGLDLGFKSVERGHASGSYYDDDPDAHRQFVARQHEPAQPNFSGAVFTNAYLDNARRGLELALTAKAPSTRVLNLSDGVRIAGAEPARSADITLEPYPEREADLKALRQAFQGGADGVWKPYGTNGAELVSSLRDAIAEAFPEKAPAWPDLAAAMDSAWRRVVAGRRGPLDLRFEVFGRLVSDLLGHWYRLCLLTQTPTEYKIAYESGRYAVTEALSQLHWPEDLEGLDLGSDGRS